ncbi:MAG: hypothetical protein SFT81_02455 [Candidatus Caenarcaniphilales bacterium]|nr:hypothetical protein [Candidatus Caenarcaniphilales bacterium]
MSFIFSVLIFFSLFYPGVAQAGCGGPGCNNQIAPWAPTCAPQLPIYPMRGCGPLGCPMTTKFRSGIIYPLSPAPACPQVRVEPSFPPCTQPFLMTPGFQPL